MASNASWSHGTRMQKKEKFMQPHQQRVVDEKIELDAKLKKLRAFIENSGENPSAIFAGLPTAERSRLARQASIMEEYSDVLRERIVNFK